MEKITMKIKPRQTRSAMSADELRTYYEQVKGSARVSENRKKYKRARAKRQKFDE